MNSKGKYIGLNQRIPFEVLDEAIHTYFSKGEISKAELLARFLEYTSGINRAQKGSRSVNLIITRQDPVLQKLKRSLKTVPYESLRLDERKAISLCLIALTFPIIYDILVALSQGLKVQNQINKKFINEKIKSIYGSNRSVDIAIDALIPMVIELNAIKRDKVSLYSFGRKLLISNKLVSELAVYTEIKLSGSKSILMDDLTHRPWFSYFDLSSLDIGHSSQLISRKDSNVGKGYLSI